MTNEPSHHSALEPIHSDSDKKLSDQIHHPCADQTENISKNISTAEMMNSSHHVWPQGRRLMKHYLFEFFMLFLAVTAGFFVENIREYYVERDREKQYIASLIHDLEADTLSMDDIMKSTKTQIKGLDTLLQVFEKPKTKQFTVDVYFYSIKYLNATIFFEPIDGTIIQLKNAGGLRLIRQDVSDSIIQYYAFVENVRANSGIGLEQFKKILEMEKDIFNWKLLRLGLYNQIVTRTPDDKINFITADPGLLDRFYNEIFMFTAMMENCNRLLLDLKPKARRLIDFLKNHYDL